MLVTCPFCPLRCDDLKVQVDGDRVTLRGVDCSVASEGFDRLAAAAESAVAGAAIASAELDSAIDRLAAFPSLIISGTMIDIGTARAAVRMAEAVGGVVDAAESRSTAAVRRAVERDGVISATLGELRQRADSVVLIGDPTADCPRLVERFLAGGPAEIAGQRRFLTLGAEPVSTLAATHVAIDRQSLHQLLAEARLALRTGRSDKNGIAAWLRQGTYTAWLWSSEAVDALAASALVGMIGEVNRQRRAVAVTLSGDATFRNVAAWLSGFSGPVDFGGAAARLYEHAALDSLPAIVWLQPFPTAPPPPDDNRFLVVIGTADPAVIDRADLYLPANVAGIDTSGSTVRGDGTVSLPLHAMRPSTLPTAADRLTELAGGIAQRRLAAC